MKGDPSPTLLSGFRRSKIISLLRTLTNTGLQLLGFGASVLTYFRSTEQLSLAFFGAQILIGWAAEITGQLLSASQIVQKFAQLSRAKLSQLLVRMAAGRPVVGKIKVKSKKRFLNPQKIEIYEYFNFFQKLKNCMLRGGQSIAKRDTLQAVQTQKNLIFVGKQTFQVEKCPQLAIS